MTSTETLRRWGQDADAGSRERGSAGRFEASIPCDCCGKGIGRNHYTDDEVCGSSDGPGFFLCGRKRCGDKYADLDVEARRALFTQGRTRNRRKGEVSGGIQRILVYEEHWRAVLDAAEAEGRAYRGSRAGKAADDDETWRRDETWSKARRATEAAIHTMMVHACDGGPALITITVGDRLRDGSTP